jgi:hypothetical protein
VLLRAWQLARAGGGHHCTTQQQQQQQQQQQPQQQQQQQQQKQLAPEPEPKPLPVAEVASATTAAGRSRSQEHNRAEAEGGHAEGASLAGHAICKLKLLSWGCSSGHRGVFSVRKANRAAGCSRGGGAGWGGLEPL